MNDLAARIVTSDASRSSEPLRAPTCVTVIVALSVTLWGMVFLCILGLS
ncbi:hypothetical protein [Azospirillum canadense]|nr:hypothetical protein [Azospirillum canadense]MCW2240939.1 hypothetical protein [Azospirillum canadense]